MVELQSCFGKLNAKFDNLKSDFIVKYLEKLDQSEWRSIRENIQRVITDQLAIIIENFNSFLEPYLKLHESFFLLELKIAYRRLID